MVSAVSAGKKTALLWEGGGHRFSWCSKECAIQGSQAYALRYPYPVSQGLLFPYLGPGTDIRGC